MYGLHGARDAGCGLLCRSCERHSGHCERFAADGIFRRRRKGFFPAPRSGSDHGRVPWFDGKQELARADERGKRFTGSRRRPRGTGRGRAREPRGTGGRAQHGTEDPALSDLPVAVSERLGRRTHLPPLQVQVGMAQRRGQVIAARACSAKVGTGFARRTCSNKKIRAKSDSTGAVSGADGSAASDRRAERVRSQTESHPSGHREARMIPQWARAACASEDHFPLRNREQPC